MYNNFSDNKSTNQSARASKRKTMAAKDYVKGPLKTVVPDMKNEFAIPNKVIP